MSTVDSVINSNKILKMFKDILVDPDKSIKLGMSEQRTRQDFSVYAAPRPQTFNSKKAAKSRKFQLKHKKISKSVKQLRRRSSVMKGEKDLSGAKPGRGSSLASSKDRTLKSEPKQASYSSIRSHTAGTATNSKQVPNEPTHSASRVYQNTINDSSIQQQNFMTADGLNN